MLLDVKSELEVVIELLVLRVLPVKDFKPRLLNVVTLISVRFEYEDLSVKRFFEKLEPLIGELCVGLWELVYELVVDIHHIEHHVVADDRSARTNH